MKCFINDDSICNNVASMALPYLVLARIITGDFSYKDKFAEKQ